MSLCACKGTAKWHIGLYVSLHMLWLCGFSHLSLSTTAICVCEKHTHIHTHTERERERERERKAVSLYLCLCVCTRVCMCLYMCICVRAASMSACCSGTRPCMSEVWDTCADSQRGSPSGVGLPQHNYPRSRLHCSNAPCTSPATASRQHTEAGSPHSPDWQLAPCNCANPRPATLSQACTANRFPPQA